MRQARSVLTLAALTLLIAACSPEQASEPVAQEPETATTPTEPADEPTYPPAEQVADIRLERVSFAPGTASVTVEGSIQGYESVDYVLNVKAGQPMAISMETPNTATYFNLIEPGETDVAIFNGSMAENKFEGVAAKSGDYRVRVYMMRSAARREEMADYRLDVAVG